VFLAFAPLAAPQARARRPRALTRPELVALATVERELLAVARAAAKAGDLVVAEREVRLGLELWPEAPKLAAELARLEKLADTGAPATASARALEALPAKREAAYAAAGTALAGAAQAVQQTHPWRAQSYWDAVRTHFPSTADLQGADLVYHAPYAAWVTREAAARLAAGDELLEEGWLDAATIEARDRAHASWSDPWVLTDGLYEVRATVPLRTARQVLAWAGRYARHILRQYGPACDLRPPAAPLVVLVTRTRTDLADRLRATDAGFGEEVLDGAAGFIRSDVGRDPVYVCLEYRASSGRVAALESFEQLRVELTRALTTQLVSECARHRASANRVIEWQHWSFYAFARYLAFSSHGEAGWQIRRPKVLASPVGQTDTAFRWCRANPGKVLPLRELVRLPNDGFRDAQRLHMAGALGWFLLEGEGGKHAPRFLALLADVCHGLTTAELFERHFAGVDLAVLQAEWERFVGAITFTE